MLTFESNEQIDALVKELHASPWLAYIATTGATGRAVRLFPDGTFDGFAPLALGKNELRLRAVSEAGASLTITRWVTFEKALPDPEQLARLRKLLELRTLETELAERARQKREQTLERQKQLEIRPER